MCLTLLLIIPMSRRTNFCSSSFNMAWVGQHWVRLLKWWCQGSHWSSCHCRVPLKVVATSLLLTNWHLVTTTLQDGNEHSGNETLPYLTSFWSIATTPDSNWQEVRFQLWPSSLDTSHVSLGQGEEIGHFNGQLGRFEFQSPFLVGLGEGNQSDN